ATLAGQGVPRGSRVILNGFLTARMPDMYPDGDVFRPERWSTITPSGFEWPVFSGGPHSCPGYLFGLTGGKLALAAILMRHRIEVPAGTRAEYPGPPTLRPRRRGAI